MKSTPAQLAGKKRYYYGHRYEVTCRKCGEKFWRPNDSKTKDTICRRCVLLERNKPGSDHPSWRGGHDGWIEGLKTKEWKDNRIIIIERDGKVCRACLEEMNLPYVHHIIPFEESHSHVLSNLIVLCHTCHESVHRFIAAHSEYPFTESHPGFDPQWDKPQPISTEEPPF